MQFSNTLILLLAFIIYSSTSIFMKLASYENYLSYKFCLFYFIAIFMIGLYAVLWQITLKRVSLIIAFMAKSVTVIFTMVIARLVFQENISINNIIGSCLVIVGILLLPIKK